VKYFLFVVLFATATNAFAQSIVTRSDLDTLRSYMVGSFSSQGQSKEDTTYLDIRLRMVPIWQHRIDGVWLYVEQAVAKSIDTPYRQRVYHLFTINDTTIVSQVYELKTPSRAVGAWKASNPLQDLRTDSLELRQGCVIMLHKSFDGVYYGATPGKQCASSRSGESYATSEVKIYPNKLLSWDRGWDMFDKQVWGATDGGYVFIKEKQ
jgi:CpeT protein